MQKKERSPIGVCTECGKYSTNVIAINNNCSERNDGKPCKGVFGSAIAPNDWEECAVCNATGLKDGQRCGVCQGSGFEYVRVGP